MFLRFVDSKIEKFKNARVTAGYRLLKFEQTARK